MKISRAYTPLLTLALAASAVFALPAHGAVAPPPVPPVTAASSTLPPCAPGTVITVIEDGPLPCNPNSGSELHYYMRKGNYSIDEGTILNWRDRCRAYGGTPDTYRIRANRAARTVRICLNVDF